MFCEKYWLNLKITNYSQVWFGKKSLRTFGPKTWSNLLDLQTILSLSNLLLKTGIELIASV